MCIAMTKCQQFSWLKTLTMLNLRHTGPPESKLNVILPKTSQWKSQARSVGSTPHIDTDHCGHSASHNYPLETQKAFWVMAMASSTTLAACAREQMKRSSLERRRSGRLYFAELRVFGFHPGHEKNATSRTRWPFKFLSPAWTSHSDSIMMIWVKRRRSCGQHMNLDV